MCRERYHCYYGQDADGGYSASLDLGGGHCENWRTASGSSNIEALTRLLNKVRWAPRKARQQIEDCIFAEKIKAGTCVNMRMY